MYPLLVVMFALSAILPIIGLVRLALGAWESLEPVRSATPLADGSNGSRGQINAAAPALVSMVLGRHKAAVWDLILVGSGLVVGAIASIMALTP